MDRLSAKINPLFSEDVVKALNKKQIFTVEDYLQGDPQVLAQVSRLVFKDVLQLRKVLLADFATKPQNGFDYYKALLKNCAILPTGIKSVDSILDGGLLTGNIYEICGPPASGKTIFALTVVRHTVLHLKKSCYYIDTKNDFSGRKMKQLLEDCDDKVTLAEALQNILVKKATNKYDLLNSLYAIKNELENGLQMRLVVIDSLPAAMVDSSSCDERNNLLNHIANIMRYIANKFYVCFLIVNLLTTFVEGDFKVTLGSTEKVACGKYWLNIPDTRLIMKKNPDNSEVLISIDKSRVLPKGKTNVLISSRGIVSL